MHGDARRRLLLALGRGLRPPEPDAGVVCAAGRGGVVREMQVDIRLAVAWEYSHRHTAPLLNGHLRLRKLVVDRLAGPVMLRVTGRRSKRRRYLGVAAGSLNDALKPRFDATGDWQFEVTVQDGVVFGGSDHLARIEGFDIARYNERINLFGGWERAASYARRSQVWKGPSAH